METPSRRQRSGASQAAEGVLVLAAVQVAWLTWHDVRWAGLVSWGGMLLFGATALGGGLLGLLAAWIGPRVRGGMGRFGVGVGALTVPVVLAWAVGWPPLYCLDWPVILVLYLLIPLGNLGWYLPLCALLEGRLAGGWRLLIVLLVGVPLSAGLLEAGSRAHNSWWHGEFVCGGGGGG